jgi:hypothetical protein
MSLLKPAPVSLRQFNWHPAERKLTGEISSTHGFGRVYDDACDEGLTVVNPRTGVEVVFVVDYVERDAEGDVRWWTLRPAAPGHDLVHDITVTLFND